MDSFYIEGGNALYGDCEVTTAKNAILPILAGSLMCNGCVVIKNCTMYSDTEYMLKILEDIGVGVEKKDGDVYIDPINADKWCISDDYTKKIRSSIFMLGPLISKFKKAKVSYPGGCNIGLRPIDLHLKGLRDLNVKIIERHGIIYCDGSNMRASDVHLDFPSVGATENIVMASLFLKGKTTIYNVAKEPEIVDLCNFLNSMGAKIYGAGTSEIWVEGVDRLHTIKYLPISDRIIAGTYMIACAMAGGKVLLKNVIADHNIALINKLKDGGVKISRKKNDLLIVSNAKLKSIPMIETMPYPGFATDLQSQILTMQTISKGISVISENLFETRYKICTELIKMGADITLKDKTAIVKGVNNLYGASVVASDLRGGAGLVLAGLTASGYTTIQDIYHIDRGYYHIEDDLSKLGAKIVRKT
jgi:UDP-N-acetylglucosamine 1-carboxyvinyltransferase